MISEGNISYYIYIAYPDEWAKMTEGGLLVCLAALLSTLNHSKNFLLYCLSSADMRHACLELAKGLFWSVVPCCRGDRKKSFWGDCK